jgi:methyl-accepting chemotaxis protein
MTLKGKLLSLVLVPLCCLSLFVGHLAIEKISGARAMDSLVELAGVSASIGALAHELQKERGMSAGFIGSGGASFGAELPKQREEVDKRKAELDSRLAQSAALLSQGRLKEDFARVGEQLAKLADIRRAVSAQSIGASDAIGYYTGVVSGLLGIVGETAALSTEASITRLAAAYSALLQAKESAGIQRATLSNVLSADRFTPEMLAKFLAVSTAEETWTKALGFYASPAQADFFKARMTGPAVEEVLRIRQTALGRMNEESLGLDAKLWFAKATERINLLKEVEDRLAGDLIDAARELSAEAYRLVALYMTLAAAAILATLLAAFKLIGQILGQIGGEPTDAVQVAHAIAAGDLTMEVHVQSGDRDSMLAAIREMQAKLREVVMSIQTEVHSVSSTAGQLSTSAQQVAESSRQQAEAASSMAAAVEEMTVSINHVSERSEEASRISSHSGDLSQSGADVIHGVAAEMQNIEGSVKSSSVIIGALEKQSGQITEIVNVIREIADQTNLLALNAAIEAARAGEQGRGFAVVADEVRKLAERTSSSTQEIAEMVQEIQNGTRSAVASMESGVEQAGIGVDLANKAGDSILGIRSEAVRVVEVVADITNALREQAVASGDIARNVEHIAQMAEENSAAVAETAGAAHDLGDMATKLQSLVDRFRIA